MDNNIKPVNRTVFFASGCNPVQVIKNEIINATKEIRIASYLFPDTEIQDILMLQAKHKNIKVLIYTNESERNKINIPKNSKVYVKLVKSTNKFVMHHKAIVIDKRIVIHGSYNFNGNTEWDCFEIEDNTQYAKIWLTEFGRLDAYCDPDKNIKLKYNSELDYLFARLSIRRKNGSLIEFVAKYKEKWLKYNGDVNISPHLKMKLLEIANEQGIISYAEYNNQEKDEETGFIKF